LSVAEPRNMREGKENWEVELWSYLNSGDGLHCPLYKSCKIRKIRGNICLSNNIEFADRLHKFLDSDFINDSFDFNNKELPLCMGSAEIFKLVRKLAYSLQDNDNPDRLPVPVDLITNSYDNLPIEVRLVPLKVYHGAVWRLKNSWVIHLNSKDTSARRRFTFYHEIFHILAHCESRPVFKKSPDKMDGIFNELLADHFSACVLVPENLMNSKWQELKDVRKMATSFDVPEPVMYLGLKFMRLI